MNMVLVGGVPLAIRSTSFGGPLSKTDGGVYPIAVGMSLRCLVSKIVNRYAVDKCASLLLPKQLGVGVKGRCEAAVHSAQSYLNSMNPDKAMVKLDLSNAFNSFCRNNML